MSAATSRTLPDFYRWGFPGAPIQIHLNLEVVSRLRKQIQDSAKGAGAFSACGVLTGDARKPGTTTILNFKPLQILDAASVEAARAGVTEEVVGFYRTTRTSGVAMLDGDRAVAESLFNRPSSVFLLIEIEPSGTSSAHFGFWGEGQIFDWPLMLFPFDEKELAIEEERRRSSKVRELSQGSHAGEGTVATAEVLSDAVPAPLGQASIAAKPAAKSQREVRRHWLVPVLGTALAVFVAAGAFAYFIYYRRGLPVPAATQGALARTEAKPSLGLAVERRGNDLRISWNGNAPLISKADFGMLLIRGSQVSRDVPLTAEELRSGSVVYGSSLDEVRFQLNVVAGEQVTREFLTVLLPNDVASRANVTSPKNVTGNPAGRPQTPLLNGSETARELRQFKPVEDRVPATATPLRMEDAPPVNGPAPGNSPAPALFNQSPVPTSPILAAPVEVPAPKAPPAEPPATVGAYPPIATNKVIPPVPPLLRGVLWKPVVVDVTVSVNAVGNVVKAEAVRKSGVNPLLSDAAVQAARRWKFRPAQFDGHPVPADIVLQFSFAGSR